MQDIIEQLKKRVQGEVRFDNYSRVLYSTDASIYEIEPQGVVIPKTADDLHAVVEIAAAYRAPIVPRGGGTSIVGNAIGDGIIIDCSKYLNKILEVNREENWVRVQPGVVLDHLNAHLRPYDLFFGPDVATSNRANLGGMIGNNSSGAHSLVYGKTIDHVRELHTLFSNGESAWLSALTEKEWRGKCNGSGFLNALYREVDSLVREHRDEIERRFPKIMRRVAGYNLDEFVRQNHRNLARLIVGSEGTLGVVTEAKLNLVPLKKYRSLAVVHFKDLFTALDAVTPIVDEFQPAAVELLDDNIIDLTRDTMEFARRLTFVEGFPAALLLVEFEGDSQKEVADKIDRLSEFLKKKKIGYHCHQAIEDAEQANVWYIRKAGLGLLMGTKKARKPAGFVEDTAVAPEHLPEYIARFDDIVRAHDTDAAYYAHASVGCLHIRPKLNLKEQADVERMAQIAEEVSSLALEFNGTISGEHGDGIAHSCWNEKMFGTQLYQAFRELKGAFDPDNILNPGKIVDAPFLTEHFRKPPNPEGDPVQPFFDYSREGGFESAVELCNGNSFCRKTDSGTMCPSYMVTLEEEHSTRGRANALRAILSGKLDKTEFTGRRLYDVLDLCITCKGCKGECPTNVDMAKLKYEFLYHYHAKNGLPLRDRLFGHIATINRLGCALSPISNWLVQNALGRGIQENLFGIHPTRTLPPFASKSFDTWFAKRKRRRPQRQQVALFNDTFMNFNYPEIGMAAVKVLEAAGYEVILPQKKCCGRPFISKGMLEQARANAEWNIESLYPLVEQGVKIVGCEPSCILTFREEYPDLVNDSRVEALAENTFLIEEFLSDEIESQKMKFNPAENSFFLHGHCHQKALVGIEPTVKMLNLIPNSEIEVIDSGCCGMAGSFGFEKEHYDISMAMGQRKLLPAVKSKGDDWQVVAPGVSCRQQIEHGTGIFAKHPVEILADHLKGAE